MAVSRTKSDPQVKQILAALERAYQPMHPQARIDAYRYNSACILVRIIDGDFSGKSVSERDEPVWEMLQKHLPEKVFCEISLLLLLTPKETQTSVMNWEFENPTPTPGSIGWNGKTSSRRRQPIRSPKSASSRKTKSSRI